MRHLPMMARFNAWANRRIYDCAARLRDADYRTDRKAFFGSIHRTLNHLLVVDQMWMRRIEGVPTGIQALDQVLHGGFAELRAARESADDHLIELVDAQGDTDRIVRYERIIGTGPEEARVGHILITLFNHQTHHRGQVHTMLTQVDMDVPPLDVLFFLEELGESGPPGTLQTAQE